jgi:3-hydroxyacyl-CoA dehydrogenase/enoyl-CoA hydratase/3-hydroxybutyryl-CoA epimerase
MSDTPGLNHRIDGGGILRIVFDRPGERVNLLNAEVLGKIDELLDDARSNRDVKAVLFGSAKPRVFVAGMDVKQIAAVTDAMEASEGARLGQAVFQKIADLGKPSVCAIGGMCLGGGTELALACTFRVAADDVKQIGLPEVRCDSVWSTGSARRPTSTARPSRCCARRWSAASSP